MITYLKRVAFVAFLYFLSGKAALLLALPPGYASPIWPAAGIALAFMYFYGVRLWPGILLGSFFINLGTSLEMVHEGGWLQAVFLSLGIAGGAVLQAMFGSVFLRKTFPEDMTLVSMKEIGTFLVCGTLVPCLVSPTIGIFSLLIFNAIDVESIFLSWTAWWVGDVIGVFICAPLALSWISGRQNIWQSRRQLLTAPFVLVLLTLFIIVFFGQKEQNTRLARLLESESYKFSAELENKINEIYFSLSSYEGFYASSTFVDRKEFKSFSSHVIERIPQIKSIAWVPKVTREEVPAFIASAQEDGYDYYQIKEVNQKGEFIPAGDRTVYFPVFYIVPLENEKALGIDNGAAYGRDTTVQSVIDKGIIQVSKPVVLAQDKKAGKKSVVFMAPIYKNNVPIVDVVSRRMNLQGFVTIAVQIETIMNSVLENIESKNLNVTITDAASMEEPFYVLGDGHSQQNVSPLRFAHKLHIGGRVWHMAFLPGLSFYFDNYTWHLWMLIVGILIFACLLNIIFLIHSSQKFEIIRIVEERTSQLEDSKDLLENKIKEKEEILEKLTEQRLGLEKQRQAMLNILEDAEEARMTAESAEQKIKDSAEDLEHSNQELEQFAYVASHDLQEPLRMVASFTQLLEKRYGKQLDEQAKEYIRYAVDGSKRMQKLIDDLLRFSRVGSKAVEITKVDLNLVMQQIQADFKLLLEETETTLIYKDLPRLMANESQMIHLFQNFISNAIKFRKEKPVIQISVEDKGDLWEFEIQDNGIGIEEKYFDKIFIIFQRLHTRTEYQGTGIGLAVCKKIIENYGGRIQVESEHGKGTLFRFTLRKGEEV